MGEEDCCFFNKYQLKLEDLPEELVDDIKVTFKVFDVDNDGMITTKELGTVLRSLGQNPTDVELQDIVNQVDFNKNGMIEFEEFVDLMMKDNNSCENDLDFHYAFR